jgi:hypothetical protein
MTATQRKRTGNLNFSRNPSSRSLRQLTTRKAPHDNPVLRLFFNCGCRQLLKNLEEATKHACMQRHKVSVIGSLSFQNKDLNNENSTIDEILMRSKLKGRLNLRFSCGCNFVSEDLNDAVEHCRKTKHHIRVYGVILSPGLKGELSGSKSPTSHRSYDETGLPHPSPAHRAGQGGKRG